MNQMSTRTKTAPARAKEQPPLRLCPARTRPIRQIPTWWGHAHTWSASSPEMPRVEWTTPSKTGLQSQTSCTPYRRLEPDWRVKTPSRTLTRLAHSHGPLPSHRSLPRDTSSKPSEKPRHCAAQHQKPSKTSRHGIRRLLRSVRLQAGPQQEKPWRSGPNREVLWRGQEKEGQGLFPRCPVGLAPAGHTLLPPPQRRPKRCGAFLQVHCVSCPTQV